MALTGVDRLISSVDRAMRTVWAEAKASRPAPRPTQASAEPDGSRALTQNEQALSAALMRVNHVGEVCAQALYDAQALATDDPTLRAQLEAAGRDETDHLAWTAERVQELGGHLSRLNAVWYGGAFALGLLAGRLGRSISLGFVVETERQVEQHLASHLDRLPTADRISRTIVRQMQEDEARHAQEALSSGGVALPAPARWAMRQAAKIMTTVAHRI